MYRRHYTQLSVASTPLSVLAIACVVYMGDERSTLPFPDALRALMEDRDVSFRKLAYLTGPHREKPYTAGYIGHLATGRTHPAPETMEVLAAAMDVRPEYFVEYRRHVAAERAADLAGTVGLDQVLKALAKLDA